jgi:hypothetical protein
VGWHDLAFFDPVTYESMRRLIVDAETQPTPRDAANLFASLDLTVCAELCEEEGGELVSGREIIGVWQRWTRETAETPSGVARPQVERPAAVFYSLKHPTSYAYAND